MTKKSKKKAVKTGFRSAESPRVTTFALASNITPQDKNGISSLPLETEQANIYNQPKKYQTRADKRRVKEEKQKQLLEAYNEENNRRLVFPIDFWYILSQYIMPEQVGIYAAICKSCHYVCSTKKFWMDLYKRCITDSKSLPSHLKPEAITTNVGLRARVIRSLYHMYKPFTERVVHDPITESTHQVEYKICESHWWKRLSLCRRNITVWVFYFKLVPPEHLEKTNIFKVQDLVNHNPEKHSSLLQVTVPSLINMLNLTGLCLTSVGVSVSRDMKHHRLKLIFQNYRPTGKYFSSQAKVIIMEPVLEVKVLDWWHPEYPHPFDK